MSAAARRCAAAIRRVGGEAVLSRPEEGVRMSFAASIQPRLSGGECEGYLNGAGGDESYTMYIPWETAGDDLRPGDTVEFREGYYSVRRAETMYLAGVPVYRWAVLVRQTGGPL